ncbi:MAG: O-antigen ligase family protein [Verrucomicrobiota bacterium]
MNPRLRLLLIGSLACLLGVIAAAGLAEGNFILAALLLGLLAIVGVEWLGGFRAETLLLGFLLVGYIVGNRGFAQIMPVDRVPLLFGELGIVFAGTLVVIRGALHREWPYRRDVLNLAVFAWLVAGSLRVWWDVRAHGFLAVRDFAAIYYALYFFIAQAIVREARAPQWLHRCLLAAFTALPIITLLFALRPDFFIVNLTFRGVPLIYQRGDLVAAFLFAGALFLLAPRPLPVWRWLFAAMALFAGFALFSRSGMVALAVGVTIWALARRWQPGRLVIAVLVLGLAGTTIHGLASHQAFHETRAYAFYERALSIFDPTGTGSYQHADIQSSGDNNQFRLVWWRTLAEEVWDKNPFLGLGFGHDLSTGFLREYYGMAVDDDFNARSPHSILFSMIGRLGLVGLLAVLTLLAALLARTRHAIHHVRDGEPGAADTLALWTIAWVVLVSAFFGVVLEGPMGAVLFWCALGLANARTADTANALAAAATISPESAPAPDPLLPATHRTPEAAPSSLNS